MNTPALLRAAREATGMTQSDVSRATGIASPNLSAIESGRVDVRMSTLERILDALDLDLQLVPRNRQITLEEAVAQGMRGRAQLVATGVALSDPKRRLEAKERRGVNVSAERSILNVNA